MKQRLSVSELDEDHVEDALPGAAIRNLRLQRKQSLQTLADASGVSVGMLSQIERNLTSPSLRTVNKIRSALNVPISALFEGYSQSGPSFFLRKEKRGRITFGGGHLVKEFLSSDSATKRLQLLKLVIPPFQGSGGDAPISYPSEKAGVVVTGQIELEVSGEKALLNEGDSFQFDGALPHAFYNPTDTPTELFWVIVLPTSQRHL